MPAEILRVETIGENGKPTMVRRSGERAVVRPFEASSKVIPALQGPSLSCSNRRTLQYRSRRMRARQKA